MGKEKFEKMAVRHQLMGIDSELKDLYIKIGEKYYQKYADNFPEDELCRQVNQLLEEKEALIINANAGDADTDENTADKDSLKESEDVAADDNKQEYPVNEATAKLKLVDVLPISDTGTSDERLAKSDNNSDISEKRISPEYGKITGSTNSFSRVCESYPDEEITAQPKKTEDCHDGETLLMTTEEPSISVCPQCGAPVDKNDKFCQECGANLMVTREPPKKYCPWCGNEVGEGNKFCMNCGRMISR